MRNTPRLQRTQGTCSAWRSAALAVLALATIPLWAETVLPAPAEAQAENVIEVTPTPQAAPTEEPQKAPAAQLEAPEPEKPAAPATEEKKDAPTAADKPTADSDDAADSTAEKPKEQSLSDLVDVPLVDLKEGDGPIYVIPLKSVVNDASFSFARRIMKKAQKEDARAVIIDMDTPGGSVDACLEYVQTLNRLGMPTYTYVNPNAISAGSIIAIGTRHIYMAPLSAIGAAAIVTGSGEDLDSTMNDKAVSILTALVRTTAVRNGHNPQLAQAFINKEVEVKIGDVMVNPKGTLLSLGANEAVREINGKPVLAAGIATDMDDLLKKAGLAGKSEVIYAEPTGFEQIGYWLSMIAPLLLIIGIGGAYLEAQAPGFGIPGFISLAGFALFFASFYIVGLAESELVVLFLLGLALVALELFILPGLFFPLVLGLLLMVLSLFLAMVDKWPAGGGDWLPQFGNLMWPAVNLLIGLTGSAIVIGIAAMFLPKSPMFSRMALSDTISGNAVKGLHDGPTSSPGAAGAGVNNWVTLGMDGIADSTLRPSGRARFGELLVDVVSDGRWIERGTPVRVKSIRGATVEVEPV